MRQDLPPAPRHALGPLHWAAALGLGLALALVALPADAQSTGTAPLSPGQGEPTQSQTGTEPLPGGAKDSLTDTVEKHDGVIPPPKNTAPAVVTPPPQAGRTPVIEPNDPTTPGDDTVIMPDKK